MCGAINVPRFATAATTIAICIGVTVSLSCPIAMRPTSICGLAGSSRRPCERSPLAIISSEG
jgi:hypothetical protein